MKSVESLTIGVCMIASALVFGIFFYNARIVDNTVKVVGSAGKQFGTDKVKWQLRISRNVTVYTLAEGYSQLKKDVDLIVAQLKASGIDPKSISMQALNTNPVYSGTGTISNYTLQQALYVISDSVATVEKIALNPEAIASKGIIIEFSRLEYFYSKVDEIKRELLGDAAKDAKLRAEEIAKSSGKKVGLLKNAQAGVFQITEPYSNEVSGYGMYDTSTKDKEIKVTVRAEFELK